MRGIVRGAVVNGCLIVRLVTGHCLRGALLVDQRAVLVGRGGSIGWAGLHVSLGDVGKEADIDRCGKPSRTEASSASNSEERHGGRWGVGRVVIAKDEAGCRRRSIAECRSRHIRIGFSASNSSDHPLPDRRVSSSCIISRSRFTCAAKDSTSFLLVLVEYSRP